MRQAYFRDAKAKYNDILSWGKPADWRFQFTTPNASTHYVYFNFNLKDGPVVFEVPVAVDGGLFGSVVDAWQVPVTAVGPAGDDKGKGGKYLGPGVSRGGRVRNGGCPRAPDLRQDFATKPTHFWTSMVAD